MDISGFKKCETRVPCSPGGSLKAFCYGGPVASQVLPSAPASASDGSAGRELRRPETRTRSFPTSATLSTDTPSTQRTRGWLREVTVTPVTN